MTSFTTRAAGSSVAPPDPTKHVNYSLGMVLGVDDLTQEFAYLTGRDQWLARDLLGYGTACGLRVSMDEAKKDEVVVTPGAAVSPRGQLIRVTTTQCAELNDWLAQERNRERLASLLGGGATEVRLYVVLSYRDCATDSVPVPGEPCRTEEESLAASRMTDDFRLELSFDAPDQREEDALRAFVEWLAQVEVTDEPGGAGFTSLADFEELVRGALDTGSPPTSRPRVRVADACEYLRAAFRIWVTELRPAWLGQGQTAGGALPTEEGVLLASLPVPVVASGGGWVVDEAAGVAVEEEERPYLLHLRMVQEWIECGRRVRAPGDSVVAETSFGQSASPGTSEAYSRTDHTHGTPPLEGDVAADSNGRTVLERIRDVPLEFDEKTAGDGQVLTYFVGEREGVEFFSSAAADETAEGEETSVDSIKESAPAPLTDGVSDASREELRRESSGGEIRKRLVEGGARWRAADLSLQGAAVAKARDAGLPEAGQVLTYFTDEGEESSVRAENGGGVWRAANLPELNLQGDVTGTSAATTVERLRGTEVVDLSAEGHVPKNKQVLTYVVPEGEEVGRWEAADAQVSGGTTPAGLTDLALRGDVTGPAGATTVRRISNTLVADLTAAGLTPQPGQVLTFFAAQGTTPARWQAATPSAPSPPALNGDVTGAASANTVKGIQGRAITPRTGAAAFLDGDVLTFRADRWVPEPRESGGTVTGDFVERPPDLPPYSIVAAGIVRGDGGVRDGSYNGLLVRVVTTGAITVTFDGYVAPDGTFQYIVKALPVFNVEAKTQNVALMFDSFLKTEGLGFVLRVTDSGQPVDGERLKIMEFMIEVSRYEIPSGKDLPTK